MDIYKAQSNSFTLIELLVTLSLIVLIVSLSIPKITSHDSILQANELNALFTTISYLQQKAISSNTEQTIDFSLSKRTYSYIIRNKKNIHQLATTIQFGYLVGSKGPPSKPTKSIIKAITCKNKKNENQMIFFPNGSITPGTIYLTNKNKTLMSALTTPISKVPFIRKYNYHNHKWVDIKPLS